MDRCVVERVEPPAQRTLPTVDAALELWLKIHRDADSRNDRRHIRQHIARAFGHIAIDRPDLIDAINYAPISRTTGKPYRRALSPITETW